MGLEGFWESKQCTGHGPDYIPFNLYSFVLLDVIFHVLPDSDINIHMNLGFHEGFIICEII